MNTEQMWDALLEMGVSEDTLQIVTSGWGYSRDTLETVLYVHTGYRTFEQASGEENEEG